MKKRKVVLLMICALLVAAVAASFAGCLKIRMTERNIEKNLKDAGAEVSQARTSPMTPSGNGYRIGTIMLAYMPIADGVSESGEELSHTDVLYVFFAGDEEAADWVEEQCSIYIGTRLNEESETEPPAEESEPQGGEASWDVANWNIYRYDNIVMCGHFKILREARGY